MASHGDRNGVDCDVLVIGAGAAGVAAAIEAASAGLSVYVAEAFPCVGGAAATGSGLTCVVDTPLQRQRGVADSVDGALQDWLDWGGADDADAEWARSYLAHSRADVYEWLGSFGVVWDGLIRTEGNRLPRQHQPRGGGGAIMAALMKVARSLPIEFSLLSEAVELTSSGGAISGAVLESGSRRREIAARSVVVASGGFANSTQMLARFGPTVGEGGRLLRGGAEQATGRGHELLEAVGAQFVGMDRVWTYAYGVVDPADPAEERGLAFWLTNDVWVNASGRRFHDESRRGGATATPALLAQKPATCWSIFDATEADQVTIPHPRFRRENGSPDRAAISDLLASSRYVHQAQSFEGLADAASLPREALLETQGTVGGWPGRGVPVEPQFGRDISTFRPIEQPPFYAVQFFPLARKCLGGVRTDLSCRVLRADGSLIHGLYAAGEVAGMAGGRLNGHAALEGTMLGPSLYSGRVAAREIARRFDAAQ
jgi:predicted oxidoreductase